MIASDPIVDDAFADATFCEQCGRENCEGHNDLQPAKAIAFTLAELARHQFPARLPILERDGCAILRAGHLGQINALRGVGKTWFLQTIALIASSNTRALGLSSVTPCRGLHIDGEMGSEELQDRYADLRQKLSITGDLPITIIAADWQEDFLPRLDTPAGQAFIEPYVALADFIILDNRSCLFDPEGEKDPVAWQPAQNYLLSLRRRGKAVMTGHHSNRLGGSRGHSKAEDALNLMIQLTRPEGYTADQGAEFVVSFEKSRGVHGAAVAPFRARLTDTGWTTEPVENETASSTVTTKVLDYLRVAHEAGDRPKSANAAASKIGGKRQRVLQAWADLLKAGTIRLHPEGGFYVA